MAFRIFNPHLNFPHDLITNSNVNIQLWQELKMLDFQSNDGTINPNSTKFLIEQGQAFYMDAINSNWRSAGLLYYYSFLNLAKAYIVQKNSITYNDLVTKKVLHGIHANPQELSSLLELEITIEPPKNSRGFNLFSSLYEQITDSLWPFEKPIKIMLSEFLPYCDDISHELENLFNIKKVGAEVFSLIRNDESQIWFEILIPKQKTNVFFENLHSVISQCIPSHQFNERDNSDWEQSFRFFPIDLSYHEAIRFNSVKYEGDYDRIIDSFANTIKSIFKGYIIPTPYSNNRESNYWLFVPKIMLENKLLHWHPVLSNYIFAFALSHILRYNPHLLSDGTKDSFLVASWNHQSPQSTLRHFLYELSPNHLRLN